MPEARTREQRRADTLARLSSGKLDGWVASSSSSGVPHLVPLSLAWNGQDLIIATEPAAITTRNIIETGRGRIALGESHDVVMIDVTLDQSAEAAQTSDAIVESYVAQADWDPRSVDGPFVILVLRPSRVQAWRETNEIRGRTLMREGHWLTD
jgi:hypothetical protein